MKSNVYLGTAAWGQKTTKHEAFAILDEFVKNDFNFVDTATNYPINGKSEDFRLAVSWLMEWQRSNLTTQLNVFVKIGSVNNLGDERVNLSRDHISDVIDELQTSFGVNLYGVGIHWDNRGEDCYEEIHETILTLNSLRNNLKLGMSGIRHPDLYFKTKEIDCDWFIQVKEYPGYTAGRENYLSYFSKNPYIAYGLSHFINLSAEPNGRRKKEVYFQGLGYFLRNTDLHGFIVAPRGFHQAKEILHFFQRN
jgi:hypothetical protein